jgi:hypothetical protein
MVSKWNYRPGYGVNVGNWATGIVRCDAQNHDLT